MYEENPRFVLNVSYTVTTGPHNLNFYFRENILEGGSQENLGWDSSASVADLNRQFGTDITTHSFSPMVFQR